MAVMKTKERYYRQFYSETTYELLYMKQLTNNESVKFANVNIADY